MTTCILARVDRFVRAMIGVASVTSLSRALAQRSDEQHSLAMKDHSRAVRGPSVQAMGSNSCSRLSRLSRRSRRSIVDHSLERAARYNRRQPYFRDRAVR